MKTNPLVLAGLIFTAVVMCTVFAVAYNHVARAAHGHHVAHGARF